MLLCMDVVRAKLGRGGVFLAGSVFFAWTCWFGVVAPFFFGFDLNLNLPLDEYGAVDFDFVQNLTGKKIVACTLAFTVGLAHILYSWT